MKRYWERVRTTIDEMSLRERAMIFVAAAFVVISLMNALLLDPLLIKQKMLSAQVVQQQEKMKELQAQMQTLLQARRDDEHSPLRERLAQLKQQLQDQDSYLQSRRDRLVAPNKMADLLKQVLDKNGRLQLVELKTLPVSLLIEKPQAANVGVQPTVANSSDGQKQPDSQKQIFKHGVQITVRGGYLDLMRYVTALEKMPAQMFWGEANLSVEKYPDAVFTLTLYTLSLGKTWMAV
jgi:MSHA biogenesis protein MshJ